jgi:hypothetical protein
VTDAPEPTKPPQSAPAAPASGADASWPALDLPAPDGPVAPIPPPKPPMPEYKGEELDAERGPGLGCFWLQVILLAFFVVFTPVTVELGWPPIVSAILLFVTLGLLLFVGQTVIFLLRIVAAERRGRRVPVAARTRTVGEIEDAATRGPQAAEAPGTAPGGDGPATAEAPATAPAPPDRPDAGEGVRQ